MATLATVAAIEILKKSLSDSAEVVTPTSANYEDSIKRWAASAEKRAAIIAFPTSVEDISKLVIFASTNKLELAVKGGGHATSGSSSTEGGLCIDLDKMRAVTVDTTNNTVTAQAGALWSDVDTEAWKHNLACVGGTVNHTGIGGLTLGGGYGWLSGSHGLTIDNLLSVSLVLANGEPVTASPNENTDLFWAMRGAGANFGVATSFTYQAHPQTSIWGGLVLLPASDLETIITFANKTLAIPDGKQSMVVAFAAPPPASVPMIMTALSYNGPEEDALEYYKEILTLPSVIVNTTHTMPYPELNTILNDGMTHGLRRTMKGSAFMAPVSLSFAHSLFNDFEAFLKKVPDAFGTVLILEYVAYSKIMEVGQQETAFTNRGKYGNLLIAPGWAGEGSDGVCREWAREMAGKVKVELERCIGEKESVDEGTKSGVGEYANYDGLDSPATTLFGINHPRLKEMKKRYDPSNLFSRGPDLIV